MSGNELRHWLVWDGDDHWSEGEVVQATDGREAQAKAKDALVKNARSICACEPETLLVRGWYAPATLCPEGTENSYSVELPDGSTAWATIKKGGCRSIDVLVEPEEPKCDDKRGHKWGRRVEMTLPGIIRFPRTVVRQACLRCGLVREHDDQYQVDDDTTIERTRYPLERVMADDAYYDMMVWRT